MNLQSKSLNELEKLRQDWVSENYDLITALFDAVHENGELVESPPGYSSTKVHIADLSPTVYVKTYHSIEKYNPGTQDYDVRKHLKVFSYGVQAVQVTIRNQPVGDNYLIPGRWIATAEQYIEQYKSTKDEMIKQAQERRRQELVDLLDKTV